MFIYLGIVCDCFCTKKAEFSNWNKGHVNAKPNLLYGPLQKKFALV